MVDAELDTKSGCSEAKPDEAKLDRHHWLCCNPANKAMLS